MSVMHTLPNELLGAIFSEGAHLPGEHRKTSRGTSHSAVFLPCDQSYDPDAFFPARFAAPVSLVCQLWRDVALTVPALWSHIVFAPVDHALGFDRARTLLARSEGYSVDMHMDISGWSSDAVQLCMNIVLQHIPRCRALVIRSGTSPPGTHARVMAALEQAPAAPHLRFIDVSDLEISRSVSPLATQAPPRLETFFASRSLHRTWNLSSYLPHIAQSLHSLGLRGMTSLSDTPDAAILLPCLCTLSIECSSEDTLAFFRACATPALRALTLACHDFASLMDGLSPQILRVLRALTHLTYISLWDVNNTAARALLDATPDLRVLCIQRALSSRFIVALREGRCARLEHLQLTSVMTDLWDDLAGFLGHRGRAHGSMPLARLTILVRRWQQETVKVYMGRFQLYVRDVRVFPNYAYEGRIAVETVHEA